MISVAESWETCLGNYSTSKTRSTSDSVGEVGKNCQFGLVFVFFPFVGDRFCNLIPLLMLSVVLFFYQFLYIKAGCLLWMNCCFLTVSESSDIPHVCSRSSICSSSRIISYCEPPSFIWRPMWWPACMMIRTVPADRNEINAIFMCFKFLKY